MPEPVIQLDNISKRFLLDTGGASYNSFAQHVARMLSGKAKDTSSEASREVWALRDLSFSVEEPSVIGVIGGNGSGKSTLLKVLSRITSPTSGRAVLNGRVSALIELNVGFHAELSGRDNVFLMGTTLGLSRQEIAESFDEIVEFSEVSQFINSPVKYYSNGMFLRLGFSVAAHLRPEILLIDEVLAVGDAAFQRKCLQRMKEIAGRGVTILFVSHQLDMVRELCQKCLVLDRGRLAYFGGVEEGISVYMRNVGLSDDKASVSVSNDEEIPVQIMNAKVVSSDNEVCQSFKFDESIGFSMTYRVNRDTSDVYLEMTLNHAGETFYRSWDVDRNPQVLLTRAPGDYFCTLSLPEMFLKPGSYTAGFEVVEARSGKSIQSLPHVLSFEVQLHSGGGSVASYERPPGNIALPVDWRVQSLKS